MFVFLRLQRLQELLLILFFLLPATSFAASFDEEVRELYPKSGRICQA